MACNTAHLCVYCFYLTYQVWNPENKAKVKRDEREHEVKQAKKRRNELMIAGEKRLKHLKSNDDKINSNHLEPIKLFKSDRDFTEQQDQNKREDMEKLNFMKKNGVAPLQLGQSVMNSNFPWYSRTSKTKKTPECNNLSDKSRRRRRVGLDDNAMKDLLDPLCAMNTYIQQTEEVLTEKDESSNYRVREKKKKKKKKSKHKKKRSSKNTT